MPKSDTQKLIEKIQPKLEDFLTDLVALASTDPYMVDARALLQGAKTMLAHQLAVEIKINP